MNKNNSVIAVAYSILLLPLLLINYIQWLIIIPVTGCILLSFIFKRRFEGLALSYAQHLFTTARLVLMILTSGFAMLLLAIVIEYQVNLPLPDYELIINNPALFMTISTNMIYIFSMLCAGCLAYTLYRFYCVLVAMARSKPI